jgi:hypothetical protein
MTQLKITTIKIVNEVIVFDGGNNNTHPMTQIQQCRGWEGVARESGRWGESNYDSCDVICGPSFGGVGHRMLIVGPLATAAVIDEDVNNNDNNDNNNRRRSGGVS